MHAELLPHDAGVYESPSLWHTVPSKSPNKATAPAHVSRAGASDVQTALVARRMNAQTQGSTVLETPLPADRMLAARAQRCRVHLLSTLCTCSTAPACTCFPRGPAQVAFHSVEDSLSLSFSRNHSYSFSRQTPSSFRGTAAGLPNLLEIESPDHGKSTATQAVEWVGDGRLTSPCGSAVHHAHVRKADRFRRGRCGGKGGRQALLVARHLDRGVRH